MDLRKYTEAELQREQYYRFPKWLRSIKVSNDAKVLYMYALDRYRLSLMNNWVDDKKEVYCYYKREEMEVDLGLSRKPLLNRIDELVVCGLWREVQQGFGKPNRIYLFTLDDSEFTSKAPANNENTEKKEPEAAKTHRRGPVSTSRGGESPCQEMDPCPRQEVENLHVKRWTRVHPNKMSTNKMSINNKTYDNYKYDDNGGGKMGIREFNLEEFLHRSDIHGRDKENTGGG